jgi:hypothetical protein
VTGGVGGPWHDALGKGLRGRILVLEGPLGAGLRLGPF